MSKNEPSISMSDCFDEDLCDYVGEMSEITLDKFLQDGAFKDFPLFSSISAMYRIGKSIGEFAHYKKLIAFINAINKGTADKKSEVTMSIKSRQMSSLGKKSWNTSLLWLTGTLIQKNPKC